MNKFFEELLRPAPLDPELVRKHESDIEFLLPRVGVLFGLCIISLAAWDFVAEPGWAAESLAIRTIGVLLAFLISMNALAIWLRKRLERRW